MITLDHNQLLAESGQKMSVFYRELFVCFRNTNNVISNPLSILVYDEKYVCAGNREQAQK